MLQGQDKASPQPAYSLAQRSCSHPLDPPLLVPQVLLIGVNNIERGPQPADELDGLIKWLKQAYPGTHFIVLNLLPTHVDVPLDTQGTNEQYQRVAAEARALQRAAALRGCPALAGRGRQLGSA